MKLIAGKTNVQNHKNIIILIKKENLNDVLFLFEPYNLINYLSYIEINSYCLLKNKYSIQFKLYEKGKLKNYIICIINFLFKI